MNNQTEIEDVKNQMVAVVGKIAEVEKQISQVEEIIADVKTKSDIALFVLAMRKEPEKHAEKSVA